MHPNQAFRKSPATRNIEFTRARSFGTLAVNSDDGPLLSHIPFILSEAGDYLEAHLVRSNPILHLLDSGADAVVSVMGGDAYISPDWYLIDDQVPTWNYVAVHLRGKLERLPDENLHDILDRTSALMEERLKPKNPWTSAKMDQDIYQKMLRQIVPIAMKITTINGTWKLSQNKTDDVRLRAADAVEASAIGAQTRWLAQQMRNPE